MTLLKPQYCSTELLELWLKNFLRSEFPLLYFSCGKILYFFVRKKYFIFRSEKIYHFFLRKNIPQAQYQNAKFLYDSRFMHIWVQYDVSVIIIILFYLLQKIMTSNFFKKCSIHSCGYFWNKIKDSQRSIFVKLNIFLRN